VSTQEPGATPGALDEAIAELERAAVRLRSDDLPPEEAAELVERCAEIAARVGAELDRRASPEGTAPGQETLL
jgi:acyl-CoA reductase-like NAD-dependent aldehyde dehydrogenase